MKQKTKFKKTEIGKIPEDWDVIKIGLKCNIKNGKTNSQDAVENGHYPLFDRSSQIKRSNRFLFDCEAIILPGEGKEFNPRYFKGKFDLHQRAYAIWKEKEGINLKFVYYWILKNKDYLARIAVGSTVKSLRLNHLENFPIAFPKNPKEQRAIASILSSLDAKIELNNKMNKALESIGQSLFKKWFIDNPGKEKWREGNLGEFGKIQPGFAFKSSDFINEGIGLMKIRNIQNFVVEINNIESYLPEEFFEKHNKFHLESGDVLIAMTGAKIGKIGIIPKTNKKLLLNQRVGKIDSKNKYLMYFILNTPEIQGLITGSSSASSAQGNISNSDIENFDYIIPPKEIIKKINNVISPIFEKIIDNLGQNQKLSKIRDILLPKLMSGEIRVK